MYIYFLNYHLPDSRENVILQEEADWILFNSSSFPHRPFNSAATFSGILISSLTECPMLCANRAATAAAF